MRVDDVVGAVAVHGVLGLPGGALGRRLRGRLSDRDQERRLVVGGQLIGIADVLAARLPARLRGRVGACASSTCCACRASVELAGLDVVAYQHDIFAPEFGQAPDMLIEPDGTRSQVDQVQLPSSSDQQRTRSPRRTCAR